MNHSTLSGALLSVVLLAGCAADTDPVDAKATQAAKGGEANAPDTVPAPDAGPKGGTISVEQTTVTEGGVTRTTTTASASFYKDAGSGAYDGCKGSIVGSCTVDECKVDSARGVARAGAPTAGNISISTSPKAPSAVLSVSELGPGYAGYYADERLFADGQLLHVTSTGDAHGVPAFEGSVVAPSDIYLGNPRLAAFEEGQPSSFEHPIDRSVDLDVRWIGGGAGYVSVALTTLDEEKQTTVSVHCSGAATDGTIVVPKAALAKLHATGPAVLGSLAIVPTNVASFVAKDYDGLRFEVSGTGATGNMRTK